MVNKELVEKRFRDKSENYNKNAILQKNIAKELVKILLKKFGNNFNNIFEIGCGTGFLTEEIYNNLNYNSLILNDLYNSKKYLSKFKYDFILGDIEKVPIPKNLDLIISSSVFQWLNDLEKLIIKIEKALNKDGIFAFSMFVNDNFKEIKDIFNIGLKYYNDTCLKNILGNYFDIIFYQSSEKILYFDSVFELLTYIKNIGINAVEKNKMSIKELTNGIKKYTEKYCFNDKYILTYNYNYVILRRKKYE